MCGIHKSESEILTRSDSWNENGIESTPDQRLNASVSSFNLPAICWISSSIENVAERRHSFSTNRHWGYFIVKSLLLPLSAPVLSLKEWIRIGRRWPGYNRATVHTIAIWARTSKAEMIFCRSSLIGMSSRKKSVLTNRSENQIQRFDGIRMKPLVPQISEVANASVAASPRQKGRSRRGTNGEKWSNQSMNIFKMRAEWFDKWRLSEEGSLILIQIRLCGIRGFEGSLLIWSFDV